jgi:hypothetical protein
MNLINKTKKFDRLDLFLREILSSYNRSGLKSLEIFQKQKRRYQSN